MELAELDAGFDPTPLRRNEGVHASFYLEVSKDQKASIEHGRPIFREYEFIRVTVAGDNTSVMARPATEMDKRRYAPEYKAFRARETPKIVGFPLSEWPGILRSQVEELKFYNVHTVEDLAAVSDVNGQKFPMFLTLREKARKYLEELEKAAPMEKVREELEARDAKIATLEETVANLVKKLEAKEDE